MKAKFAVGTKVRIRVGHRGLYAFSDLSRYDNLTGEVISSMPVVAYVMRSWRMDEQGVAESIQCYRVRLQEGIELTDLLEDCLEEVVIT